MRSVTRPGSTERQPDTQVPGLGEARQKLIYYNMNKAEQLAYDEHINAVMIQNDVLSTAKDEGREEGREEGRAEGRAEGREEGREEGKKEGKVEIARKMKSMSLAPDLIQSATGLSMEEIDGL